jgi:kynurenine formamidase
MCVEGTAPPAHTTPITAEPERTAVGRRALLKAVVAGGAGTAVAVAAPTQAWATSGRSRKRAMDLTHVFRAGFPVYTFDNPTRETVVTVPRDGFYSQRWTFTEHSGTHLDVPGHFVEGARLAPELRLDELFVPVVVVDVSARAATDPDTVVTQADLVRFERRRGRIPRHALVCMYSGWEARVGDQDDYRNPGPDGRFHFPGFGLDAVEWLLARRDIAGIGVDTLSLDNGPSTTFDVHRRLLGADRYGVENLRNLSRIPARGASAFVGLIPWEAGSGGPARIIVHW